ncbi:MAG: hypothetical protein LBE13_01070 [Bacteroidales bacterium]|nr:hypothetical protein [Bacteroidales bacterium]
MTLKFYFVLLFFFLINYDCFVKAQDIENSRTRRYDKKIHTVIPIYTAEVFSSPLIFYYNAGYQGDSYIWDEHGTFAWKNPRCDRFFIRQIEPVKLHHALKEIKEHYEEGKRFLGGQRSDRLLNTLGNSPNTHFQIISCNYNYYRSELWNTNIIKYFEENGIDSLDMNVSNYRDVFPFNSDNYFALVDYQYLPSGKNPDDTIGTEDTSYILRQFKEDITHLLYCKNIAKSFRDKNKIVGEGDVNIEIFTKEAKLYRYGNNYQYQVEETFKKSNFWLNIFKIPTLVQ